MFDQCEEIKWLEKNKNKIYRTIKTSLEEILKKLNETRDLDTEEELREQFKDLLFTIKNIRN